MNVEERLKSIQILDGGVSTEIADSHGKREINNHPLWSSRLLKTDPQIIKDVHNSFLSAGSDIIQTVTYQASIEGFEKHFNLTSKDAFDLIKKGAELAISARDEFWNNKEKPCVQKCKPLIAGSLGPYGACLCDGSEYTGNYIDKVSKQTLIDFHKPRVEALLAGGVDLIAFDTVPALEEGVILAEIMELYFPDCICWISFQCKDSTSVAHGESFADCFEALVNYKQVAGVGINCTAPQLVSPLLNSLPVEQKLRKPLIVYPNRGDFYQESSWKSQDKMVHVPDFVCEWVEQGAKVIGGCCKITPANIKQIRTNLNHVIQ